MLPCVSGNECIRVLEKSGFEPTEERDGFVWLERDACGIPVPRDAELDGRILEVILDSARMDPGAFREMLDQVRAKA